MIRDLEMDMTKALIGLLATLAAALVPVTASASCFFVYGPKNELIYRSTITPVDLSRPISEGMRGRFSGGHLVMIPDETGCPDLLAGGESKLFATLGFTTTGSGRSTSAINGSPLFRSVGARPGTDASDAATMTDSDGASPASARRRPRPTGAARSR
jgi:hypothetical protein